jgi:NhaP-type Na+/H+ or K+/H+ antiporter
MPFADWSLGVGALLIGLVLSGTLIERLPLSSAMLYLGLGALLGPGALDLMRPDPGVHTALLEHLAEAALLISLFAVGLRLEVPLRSARWWLPLRLAFGSMALLVALIAAVGVWLLDLSLGAAVLLGAVLAPTDPVLASGVESGPGTHPDRVGFSLAGEGGLNDGAAFPFVMLGLGLMGLHELGAGGWRWWTVDLLWATLGGALIGWLLGSGAGRLVLHLRARHGEALGLDMFLGLGLLALANGLALAMSASGFLAVFASGLALQRVRPRPPRGTAPLPEAAVAEGHAYETLAVHPHHASAAMRDTVRQFNGQLEKLAELALVILVGAMLTYAAPLPAVAWFVPLLLLVLRPLSMLPAFAGSHLSMPQAAMIGWFGIRGVGSVFYLLFALRQGIEPALAELLVSLTLWTVAASIVAHGVTVQPLMRWYQARANTGTPPP